VRDRARERERVVARQAIKQTKIAHKIQLNACELQSSSLKSFKSKSKCSQQRRDATATRPQMNEIETSFKLDRDSGGGRRRGRGGQSDSRPSVAFGGPTTFGNMLHESSSAFYHPYTFLTGRNRKCKKKYI